MVLGFLLALLYSKIVWENKNASDESCHWRFYLFVIFGFFFGGLPFVPFGDKLYQRT
jgi:hypothetical protein